MQTPESALAPFFVNQLQKKGQRELGSLSVLSLLSMLVGVLQPNDTISVPLAMSSVQLGK